MSDHIAHRGCRSRQRTHAAAQHQRQTEAQSGDLFGHMFHRDSFPECSGRFSAGTKRMRKQHPFPRKPMPSRYAVSFIIQENNKNCNSQFTTDGGSVRRPAEMATADLPKDSKPPLTFRPNLAFKKGERHGRQAAYDPSGGFLFRELDIRLLYRGDSPRGGEMSS